MAMTEVDCNSVKWRRRDEVESNRPSAVVFLTNCFASTTEYNHFPCSPLKMAYSPQTRGVSETLRVCARRKIRRRYEIRHPQPVVAVWPRPVRDVRGRQTQGAVGRGARLRVVLGH